VGKRAKDGSRRRARRTPPRICTLARLLRPRHRRIEPRPASADCFGRVLRRPRHSPAVAQHIAAALVPRQRAAHRPTHDADDHRPLQRAYPRPAPLHLVLIGKGTETSVLSVGAGLGPAGRKVRLRCIAKPRGISRISPETVAAFIASFTLPAQLAAKCNSPARPHAKHVASPSDNPPPSPEKYSARISAD